MSIKSISPLMAILININIVIGAAFYLGASEIAQRMGCYAPLTWAVYGLLLLPLQLVFFHLAHRYPQAGGIFVYSHHALGPRTGFMCGWGYFIGTMAGNAAILIAFTEQIRGLIDSCVSGSLVVMPLLLVLLFTLLSLFNIALLERLQLGFALLKIIPFAVLVIGALLLADRSNLATTTLSWDGMLSSLPLVLFSYIGLEACCAVIDKIKGPSSRASGIILSSFVIISIIYVLAQSCILLAFGTSNVDPFTGVLPRLINNTMLVEWGNMVIRASILLSFLGGFYAMFYYNNWNLYAIAQSKHCIGSSVLTRLNHNQAPWVCVLVQAMMMILLLVLIRHTANFVAMSDVGITIAYLLSTMSYIVLYKTSIIGWTALGVCMVLIALCIHSLMVASLIAPLSFLVLLGVGAMLYRPYKQHS